MTLFKRELPSSTDKKASTAADLQGTYEAVIKELRTLFKTVETMGKAPNALSRINQIFVEIGLKKSEQLVAGNVSSPSTGSRFYKDHVADMRNKSANESEKAPEEAKGKSFTVSGG